jgi:hypothetical protein
MTPNRFLSQSEPYPAKAPSNLRTRRGERQRAVSTTGPNIGMTGTGGVMETITIIPTGSPHHGHHDPGPRVAAYVRKK